MRYSTNIFYSLLFIFLIVTGNFNAKAQSFKLDTIVYKGDPAKFINLVFMGDGFQAKELNTYLESVRKLNNYLFSISPFTEYANFFNVFAISVPSPESGATHPGTATDESTSGNQPVVSVNTSFNSTFDYAAIHRLLVPQNYSAIYDVLANNAPYYDEIFMLVNSEYYGGSGSPNLATSSLNTASFEVLVHEIGHSFGGLSDEYYAGDNYAGENANMTQESNPNLVKWKDWIGVDGVGVYQHCCGGNSAQWYKPHQSCKMQSLGSPFCAVCRETLIEKIYDLVPSLKSFEPSAQTTIDYCTAPVRFKLNLNKPFPNTLKVTWLLNGNVVASNVDSLTINGGQLNSNSNILSAIVIDTTFMVRSTSHFTNHSDTVSWTISNSVKIPIVTVIGPTTLCEGKSVTLKSDAVNGNRWYKNGVLVPDSIAATFVARESGSYTVKTKVNTCESGASNAINVTILPNPSPAISASSTSLCGQTITLTTATGTGNIYQWKKDNINIPGATSHNYNASVPGVYTVAVSNAAGCSATSAGINITPGSRPLVTIAAAGATTFCAGKNVLLVATVVTGYSYQWRKSGVVLIGATSSNYQANATGVYSVEVTNAGGCSTTSAAINVIVNPVPLATVVAGGPLTFCAGKNVLLKATPGAGYIYQWKKGISKLEGQTSSNFTATETGVYIVEVTNASGCSVISSSFNVVVNSLPIATITPNGPLTFCSGKNVILRTNTGTGYTYQWKRGGTNIAGANGFTYTATTTGFYNVVVTNPSGCSVTSPATAVVVNALPIATIAPAGPLTFCAGKNVLLRANTGTAYTYQWKKAGVNIVDNGTQSNYTASSSGVYSVVVTNANGCSVTSAGVTVTVNNAPLAAVAAAGPTNFCAGKNVMLKTIIGAGYTYQWKKNGYNISGQTLSTLTANSTGLYTVVVTNAGGCSTTSAAINVIVNPVPLATVVAGGPLTFCAGKNVLLKATPGAGYIYQWKKGISKLEGQTSSNFTATETGVYTVEVTNASGCSVISSSFNVVVNSLPIATITPNGPLTFCSGKNVILRTNTGTGYTYQWKRGGTNIAGANGFTYTATTTGFYNVVVTNPSGCSVTSPATAVVVNALPIATIAPAGPLTFCAGKNVLLRANTGTAYTYQWKKAGVNIVDNGTQSNYTASSSGVYSVVVTNANGCSVTSAGVTVTVNNAPLATVAAAGPTNFCAGKNVLLKAIIGAGYTYQWKRSGVVLTGQTSSTYLADATGVYSVEVSNAAGCSTTSVGISVSVTPAPPAAVAAAGPTTFCSGKSVLLKANLGTGYTYQWKKNGYNISGQTLSTLTANSTGLYTVVVTNAQGCPTTSAGIDVMVNPAPLATITPSGPLTFPQGGNVVLNATPGTGYIYQWKKDGVIINGAESPSYSVNTSGNYTVGVTNSNLCQSISQPVQVTVTSGRLITKSTTYLNVYPNPLYRDGYLNIERSLTNAEKGVLVTISDLKGRMINSRFLKPDEKKLRIPGASGIYIVEIRWGLNERRVFRIIKIE